MKAFDGGPPNRCSLSLKFPCSSAEPSAGKKPSSKASPLRGGSFFRTRLGKGSSCSQLSSTAPGMPDLSRGFDLATSSCLALTGQAGPGRERRRGGEQDAWRTFHWAACQAPEPLRVSCWENLRALLPTPHFRNKSPRLRKITGLNYLWNTT